MLSMWNEGQWVRVEVGMLKVEGLGLKAEN